MLRPRHRKGSSARTAGANRRGFAGKHTGGDPSSRAACDPEESRRSGERPLDIAARTCIIVLIQLFWSRWFRSGVCVQIHVSTNDGLPIYLQIVNQIKYQVASGRLTPGEELPAIRVLAERLLVNPNTVARAYRELEMAGLVEKRRTAGTFVADQGSPLARRERVRILSERIDALLAEAGQMDIPFDDVVKLLQQRRALMQAARQKD